MGDLTKDLESAIAERLKEGSTAAEIAELLEPVMKSNLRAKYGRAFLWLIAGLDGAVVAIVVLRNGSELAAETLREHCAARLARYKVPKRVDFIGTPLPRTPSGKLLRRELQ